MGNDVNQGLVVVLGASSDIGVEIIRKISKPDMKIIAHCNSNKAKLESLQADLAAEIVPVEANLCNDQDLEVFIAAINACDRAPEKVVHLAAPRVDYVKFKNIQWSDFQKNIDVQVKSFVAVMKNCVPAMIKARKGKVVVVLSSYTLNVPPAFMSHYVSVKYALLGLVKSLASEYASKRICFNAVSPSLIETAFLENIPDKIIEFAAEKHPLKRNATPKDIAPLVDFLLSPEADFLNGVNIPISGGETF